MQLSIHDARGALVVRLVDAEQTAGAQSAEWDGSGHRGTSAPSGVDFARLKTVEGVRSVKITLAK